MLSHDMENDPDIVAMIATSAALTLSGVPSSGRSGRARRLYRRQIRAEPDDRRDAESALDLVVAGTANAVLMVESEAKELPRRSCSAP